jgi:transposase-like protein
LTENEARSHLESIRWPHHLACSHCGSVSVTRLHGKKHRPGVIQCNDCRKQFTVTVGSIMEDSHLSLQKWVLAFHLLCSSKKGFSALQLQRELGIGSYRTASFVLHRIREAMSGPLEQALQSAPSPRLRRRPESG